MRIPLRCTLGFLLAAAWSGACAVDNTGLGIDATGARAGTGAQASGRGGSAGIGQAGTTGGAAAGGAAGTVQPAGTGGAGTAGTLGAGGTVGTGGSTGAGGNISVTGAAGTSGGAGTGGTTGTAGSTGTAGAAGSAGMGGSWGGGRGGRGGQDCNATNCAGGCCQNGQCVSGDSNQACGSGGVQCRPCGACFRCGTSNTCELEPAGPWTVTCVSATVKSTKANGEVWDTMTPSTPASAPDPVCRLDVDTRSRSSSTITDSLSPAWSANVTPTSGGALTASLLVDLSDRWKISVVDSDAGTGRPDDTICSVSPHPTAKDLENGTLTLTSVGQCTTVTLAFTCAN